MSAAACALCGAPVGRAGQSYCCEGCARVADVLAASGFTGSPESSSAYAAALRAGLLPGGSPRRESIASGHERRVAIEIEGMWCPSCGWLVEHVLRATTGVADARVAFLSERAEVRFDPSVVGEAGIRAAIESLGYRVRQGEPRGGDRALWMRFGFAAVVSTNVGMLSYAHYAQARSGEAPEAWLSWVLAAVSVPAVLGAGWPILRRGLLALRAGAATMQTSIAAGSLAALGYSVAGVFTRQGNLYFDVACSLITFWLLGRVIERTAFRRAAEAGTAVARLLPRKAKRLDATGGRWVDALSLAQGDAIEVAPGERVPVDGRVAGAAATVCTAVVDGEPRSRTIESGGFVAAGSSNGPAVLRLEVAAPASESTLARIAAHVAASAESPAGEVTDALARWLLGLVALLAGITFAGWIAAGAAFATAFERGLAVLVVSCPCALAVAAPLARLVAAGRLARHGIVARGEGALDAAAEATMVAFDKTGTLTRGEPEMDLTAVQGWSHEEALRALAALESGTAHPIAAAVKRAGGEVPAEVGRYEVVTGSGVGGLLDGRPASAGKASWVEMRHGRLDDALRRAVAEAEEDGATAIVVAHGSGRRAVCVLRDQLRPDARRAVEALREMGLASAVLSGDAPGPVRAIAREAGIGEFAGRLDPLDKARWLQSREPRPIFVGDGINDAPALAAAIGVAVAHGTDFARETAAVLLLEPELTLIPRLVATARRMRRVLRENLGWALTYNLVAIPLAAAGLLDPIVAAAAMVTSSALVTINSLRQ